MSASTENIKQGLLVETQASRDVHRAAANARELELEQLEAAARAVVHEVRSAGAPMPVLTAVDRLEELLQF